MADPHVVTALVRKRSELAGQIEHTQATLRQLVIDLDNLDATLRLFQPDVELEAIKPKPFPPKHHAFRGEVTRIVFDALRQAKKPLTSQELGFRVLAERGLDVNDASLHRLMSKRAAACLRHYRKKGIARAIHRAGDLMLWELI